MVLFLNFLLDGQECVHVLRNDWAKYMWQKPDLFPRTNFLETYFPLMKNGVFLAKDEHHRFQKKIILKAFSKPYLENYVPIFDKHAKFLIDVSICIMI